ncbi:MAG: hypothetical protein NVSMB52_15550 [Chloroflexota bacterium]
MSDPCSQSGELAALRIHSRHALVGLLIASYLAYSLVAIANPGLIIRSMRCSYPTMTDSGETRQTVRGIAVVMLLAVLGFLSMIALKGFGFAQ